MTGLVLELQRDALSPEIKVSNLLRKAFVISKKLGIVEIEEWLNKELNGYLDEINIPEYRIVYGEIKARNPYRGLIPLFFEDSKLAEKISKRKISQPVIELEKLSECDSDTLNSSFSFAIESYLISSMTVPFKPILVIGKIKVIGLLEAVRKIILDWTLELEQQGILGEGMSFSNEEKTKAHQTTYQITNNIGSMYNSQLQQDSAYATQSLNVTETNSTELKKFVEELKSAMDSLELAQEQFQELKEAIAMLEIQANSTKPNNLIIKESGRTARNIIEGAIGSTVSSGLVAYFHLFQ